MGLRTYTVPLLQQSANSELILVRFFCEHKGFLSRRVDGILQLKYVSKPHGRIPPLSHFIWAIFSVKKDLTKNFNAPTKFLNNFDEIKKRKYDEL